MIPKRQVWRVELSIHHIVQVHGQIVPLSKITAILNNYLITSPSGSCRGHSQSLVAGRFPSFSARSVWVGRSSVSTPQEGPLCKLGGHSDDPAKDQRSWGDHRKRDDIYGQCLTRMAAQYENGPRHWWSIRSSGYSECVYGTNYPERQPL